ncbi:DUF3422 family protein [Paracoccaceae bacterium GXU_MW_L88]
MTDHSARRALINELHARPFPTLKAPASAAYLALTSDADAPRAAEEDRAHLIALLDRFGAPHPAPDAEHYFADLGPFALKWERHTEFVTYTLMTEGVSTPPFQGDLFAHFPKSWINEGGVVMASALLRIETAHLNEPETLSQIDDKLRNWFVAESLAASKIADGNALIAGDFRLDAAGHSRFAVFTEPSIDPRRLGRIVQRLLELETYRAMAMLALPVAQRVSREVARLDADLTQIMASITREDGADEASLENLLRLAAEVELLISGTSFRFGAAEAYRAIVDERLTTLREQRVGDRQVMSEFMLRRFDPAMRTCRSVIGRVTALSERANRAANLLRTRVDVRSEIQSRDLLASMNRRADLQLRLQETVEGLSAVAISYYAVGLAGYLGAPLAKLLGISKDWLMALIALPVLAFVWYSLRRLRRHLTEKHDN